MEVKPIGHERFAEVIYDVIHKINKNHLENTISEIDRRVVENTLETNRLMNKRRECYEMLVEIRQNIK